MSFDSQNFPPTLRRILNRLAILVLSPEAVKFEGVSCQAISTLLADCENALKTDIEIANALFSRIANHLEDLESRLEYKNGTEIKKFKESWRRVAIGDFKEEPDFSFLPTDSEDNVKITIKLALQKWFTVSQETIARRIKAKDLLTLSELQAAKNVEKKQIRNALKADRMFFVVAPDNEKYYPSFFTDINPYFQKCIEKVCKQLATVPSAIKYGFLTTSFHSLGDRTPIEALHEGKLEEVINIAYEIV